MAAILNFKMAAFFKFSIVITWLLDIENIWFATKISSFRSLQPGILAFLALKMTPSLGQIFPQSENLSTNVRIVSNDRAWQSRQKWCYTKFSYSSPFGLYTILYSEKVADRRNCWTKFFSLYRIINVQNTIYYTSMERIFIPLHHKSKIKMVSVIVFSWRITLYGRVWKFC